MKNYLIAIIGFIILIVVFAGCNEVSKPSISGKDKFIGTWIESKTYEGSIRTITYVFSSDKIVEFNATYKDEAISNSGIWNIIDNKLIININNDEIIIDYQFSDNDTILTITDSSGNSNVLIKQ